MRRDAVVRAFLVAFEAELDGVEAMAAMAAAEATGGESKAEGKYDTRATEASYLARGQAERVASLRGVVAWFRQGVVAPTGRVGVGSLVHVTVDGAPRCWFVVPDGGGCVVVVRGAQVTAVTPRSPLAAALVGAEAGDAIGLYLSGRDREVEVISVA